MMLILGASLVIFIIISELHLDIERLSRQVLCSLLFDMWWQALCSDIVQLLMVYEYLGWQALQNPLVSNGFVWRHSLIRVPLQTAFDEVDERLIAALKDVVEDFRTWLAHFTMRVRHELGHVILIEELCLTLALSEHFRLWNATDLHDKTDLICFILSREYWITHCKLSHDAAETPHVNTRCVRNAKNDLRSSIESRLDVSVHTLILEA